MAETRKKKSREIPLTFGENIRYVKGVTKYTTCSDVIKMVLRKLDDGKENGGPEAYGIYESSRGIERLLPAKSKLLKVMRSWGMTDNYEFVFRKVNTKFPVPKLSETKRRKLVHKRRDLVSKACPSTRCSTSKYSHPNEFVKELYFNEDSDTSLEEFMSSVDQKNMAGILNFAGSVANSELNKLSSVSTCDISRNVTGQSDDNNMVYNQNVVSQKDVNHVKYAVRKTLKPKSCRISSSESSLEDACSRSSLKGPLESSNIIRRHTRESHRAIKRHEKLATDIVNKVGRLNHKEGKEAILQKYFADYITYRSPAYKYRDSRFRERGDGADSDCQDDCNGSRRVTGSGLGYCPTPARRPSTATSTLSLDDTDSGHEDDSCNFDKAFIDEALLGSEDAFVSAEHETDTAVVSNDYDTCDAVGKLVDYSLSEEDSILSDPSDISTCSEHVHNVSSVSDIVKTVFNENKSGSEDDEMESFMNTKIYDDLSDEGLSSLGSDDEKEIIV